MSENKTKKPKKNFFVFYCIILFLLAAILVTFSYFSSARMEMEQQLVDTTEGFTSRLEKANAKNAEFEAKILDQQKQIDELTKKVNESEITAKKSAASDYLWKLVKASYQKNYKDCKNIIAAIDSEGLRQYLSEDGLKELQRIEKNTKGV